MPPLTTLVRSAAVAAAVMTSTSAASPLDAQRPTASIVDHGAVGDGQTLNTASIQAAIDRLAADGGGTLVVPQGRFLTGAIFLKPGVDLHLEAGGVLLGSTDLRDYPIGPTRIEGHTEAWRPALVNADRCDRLRITGDGTIQGGGKPFWDAFWAARRADPKVTNLAVHRPRNLFIRDSRDVVVSGVRLRDSGFWNLHLYRCRDVTVDAVDIRTPPGAPSTDGIDVDSCQDVTIRGCHISVDDDNIALKGSKGPAADHDADSPAVERVHVVDCTFAHGHAALTCGSEASRVSGVLMERCRVIDAPGESAASGAHHTTLLKLKLRPDTPQRYADIHVRDVTLAAPRCTLVSFEAWTQFFDLGGLPAPAQVVERVTIERVTGTAGAFGKIAGPPRATVRGVTLRDIDLTVKTTAAPIDRVDDLTLDHVTLNGEPLRRATPAR